MSAWKIENSSHVSSGLLSRVECDLDRIECRSTSFKIRSLSFTPRKHLIVWRNGTNDVFLCRCQDDHGWIPPGCLMIAIVWTLGNDKSRWSHGWLKTRSSATRRKPGPFGIDSGTGARGRQGWGVS